MAQPPHSASQAIVILRHVKPDPGDDFDYLEWVESVITGVVARADSGRYFVVKIDNWFGRRWLGFSGKSLGALAIHRNKLTLPPFIPSRVASQYMYWRDGTDPGRQPGLHRYQPSRENLQRYVDVVVQNSSVFWYSGRSAANGRASFMAYVSTPDGHWPWYVGLQRTTAWRVTETIGIGAPEIEAFRGH